MRREPVQPGERRWRVTIQQGVQGTDAEGAPETTWTTLVERVPAARYAIRDRERFVAEQESARFDERWEIGYRADMDPDLVDVPALRRLVFRGRTIDITAASVISVGGVQLMAVELKTLASTRI